jgi:hypothetical protein
MTAWVVSRRVTAVAVAMVAAAGGVAVAAGGPAGQQAGQQVERQVERAAKAPPRIISIAPQGVHATSMSSNGPNLPFSSNGELRVGFVIPPDRGTKPLRMRLVYVEQSADACKWTVSTSGLEGPDAPNSEPNVHNGAWSLPGTTDFAGDISVPAGPGSAHTAIFKWRFPAKPGMFVQFALIRAGAAVNDTCGSIMITGMQVHY